MTPIIRYYIATAIAVLFAIFRFTSGWRWVSFIWVPWSVLTLLLMPSAFQYIRQRLRSQS